MTHLRAEAEWFRWLLCGSQARSRRLHEIPLGLLSAMLDNDESLNGNYSFIYFERDSLGVLSA